MTTFALIKQNNCTFDDLEKYVTPLLYVAASNQDRIPIKKSINDYIWSVIEPHIEFITTSTDQEEMLTCMCTKLIEKFPNKKFDDFYYHTEPSYSFPKKYIEQVYYHIIDEKKDSRRDSKKDSKRDSKKDSKKDSGSAPTDTLTDTSTDTLTDTSTDISSDLNYLGCLFNLKHHAIEHTCAILANTYDMSSDCFVRISSVTKEDILRVIRRRFYFSAVLIKEQSFVKYYYQNLTHLISQVFGVDTTSSISKITFTLFRYNIVFYFKPNNTNAYVNQTATRMAGSHITNGDVLMIHELDNHVYGNISIREAKRLNVLSYGRLYDRDLKEDELKPLERFAEDVHSVKDGKDEVKKVIPVWSRYLVVERRMMKWQKDKNKCIYCGLNKDKLYPCAKCFRVKYCSSRCEEDFRSYHCSECF